MLKLDDPRPATRQCDHCPGRRTGLCDAFADGAGLPLADLEAAHLPVRVLEAGDIIFSQGEVAAHVYSVVSGWIQLHQDLADGRRCISQFLLPGESFGVSPQGARHARSASAVTAASICAIPSGRLNDLQHRHPSFNERLIWMLESDNLRVTEALTMTAQGSSLERVASIMWGLAAKLSKPGAIQAGVALKVPLTQRHIADATGLTAIHVNRVVRRLREQGLVELRDGVMVIEDPDRLAVVANEGTASDSLTDRAVESSDLGSGEYSTKGPSITLGRLPVSHTRRVIGELA